MHCFFLSIVHLTIFNECYNPPFYNRFYTKRIFYLSNFKKFCLKFEKITQIKKRIDFDRQTRNIYIFKNFYILA